MLRQYLCQILLRMQIFAADTFRGIKKSYSLLLVVTLHAFIFPSLGHKKLSISYDWYVKTTHLTII